MISTSSSRSSTSERDVTKREVEYASTESLLESQTIRVERRERRISGGEALAQRLRELDEREDAIERREVSVETDHEIGHENFNGVSASSPSASSASPSESRASRCTSRARSPSSSGASAR